MKKRVGIIGYGMVASSNHKKSYARAKDAEVVAVCDVNKQALERAKRISVFPMRLCLTIIKR